jgi:triosephosphate isomerase
MYKTPAESLAFLKEFLPLVTGHERDEILLFPTMTSLATVLQATAGTSIHAGAQNMHWLDEGPYTGETSPTMLAAIGCGHILIGHSEQRLYFGETDERVNLKLKAAIRHNLTPIVCVGEHLDQREAGQTETVLRAQLSAALKGVSPDQTQNLVIAYEPVWAIGTGKTATPEIAEEAHAILRHELGDCCGTVVAQRTRILYGGSVKPDNVSALMAKPEIDGALVGGASLVPASFAALVHYA